MVRPVCMARIAFMRLITTQCQAIGVSDILTLQNSYKACTGQSRESRDFRHAKRFQFALQRQGRWGLENVRAKR